MGYKPYKWGIRFLFNVKNSLFYFILFKCLDWVVSFNLKEAYIGFFFSNVKGLQFYQSM